MTVQRRHIKFLVSNFNRCFLITRTVRVTGSFRTSPAHFRGSKLLTASLDPVFETVTGHIVALVFWTRVGRLAPVSAAAGAVFAITSCRTVVVVLDTSHDSIPVFLRHRALTVFELLKDINFKCILFEL